MSAILNQLSNQWFGTMVLFELQNTIFILFVLLVLQGLKTANAALKRSLVLIALIKTLVPPFFNFFDFGKQTFPLANNLVDSVNALAVSVPIEQISERGLSTLSWLFLFWLAGMFTIGLIFLINHLKLYQLARTAKTISVDHPFTPLKIHFSLSEQITNPVTFGLFKARVLLPKNWPALDENLKKSILLHEINHVRARDLYWNFLKALSLMVHFFNPVNWLLIFLCDLYIEMSCDDLTVSEGRFQPKHYIKNILNVAESMSRPDYLFGKLNFSRAFYLLKQRIAYQLKQEDFQMKDFGFLRKVLPILLVMLMIPFSWQCKNSGKETIQEPDNNLSGKTEPVIVNNLYPYYLVDEKPVMLHKERPVYPEKARRAGISGLVVVTITIDENGNVSEAVPLTEVPIKDAQGNIIRVQKAHRYPELEPAAIAAALKCKFKPAKVNGQPVKVKMNVPFRFRLH